MPVRALALPSPRVAAIEPRTERSIAALVDAACADAGEGIAASQKAFAVKMIEGLGYAGEAGFVQEAPKLDWGRHMPGFPCRVELCLKNFLNLA